MKRKAFLATMVLSLSLGTMNITWAGASIDESVPQVFSDGTIFEQEEQIEQNTFSDGAPLLEEPSASNEIKELEDGTIELKGVIYRYEEETDTYTVVGGRGQKVLDLPMAINGKYVTAIAPKAFYYDTVLEDIEIKEGIQLETIGESAFEGCVNLTKMLSAEFIGKNAYNGCENLIHISLGEGEFVSSGAFQNCPRLRTIDYARIKGDLDIFDPDNKIMVVSESGGNPFKEYNIRYDTGAEFETKTFDEIGYITYLGGFLIHCSEDAWGKIAIEDNTPNAGKITKIGRNAFYSCQNISSVSIPDTVTTIETKAFNQCVGLSNVEIPASVTEIEEDAFLNCPNVTIYTTTGSYAQQYAEAHGIACITENDLAAPAAPVYKKVTGNVATASIRPVEGADGYEVIIGYEGCQEKGNYWQIKDTKTLTTSFDHVRHGTFYSYVRAYKTEDGEKIYSDWSDGSAVYVQAFTPSTPKFNGITVSGSTVIVDMRCDKNWTGYDVVLGKSKNSIQPTNYAYIAKNQKRGRIVFKNVKKGTYYVGAHTFNRTGTTSAKVFSQWSDIRKITIK